MSNEIKVNFENLTEEERETLMRLVEKANTPKSKVWKPKNYERYYFIKNSDTADNSIWNNDSVDFRRYDMGNIFKTRKEAEFAAEKQKVIVELKRYAIEHNEGIIRWADGNEYKYHISYSHELNKILISSRIYVQDMAQVYFTSMKIAQDAINAVGEDRLKKYLFGIE
ncbi:MAG: hypothetical protein ACOX1S_05445 [Anaerostipes sp.]|jgi:hypothetical protein